MSVSSYPRVFPDAVLTHTRQPVRLLREFGDVGTPEHIAAMVASGDCFLTLATIIEKISESLEPDDIINVPELEQLAATLFYMQRYYTIYPKTITDDV